MKNGRQLLTEIGIGQFNATMVMPYMMMAPRTTDPKSAPVILLIRAVQSQLYQMGATEVGNSGRWNQATADALARCVGPNWERMSWGSLIQGISDAKATGVDLSMQMADPGVPIAVGGPLDFLPDVPGGLLTYGIVGFLAYRHFSKRRRAS